MAMLNNLLMSWLNEKNVLNEYQSGYLGRNSTVNHILNLSSVGTFEA